MPQRQMFQNQESQELGSSPRVVAVVVTFNRIELLPLTLEGIHRGLLRPDAIVIVNNASTDNTSEFLESLESDIPTDIVNLPKNMGGAGGFTVGIDRALMRHGADLVWVMDDDTEPTSNTLAELVKAWQEYSPVRGQRPALIASKVIWDDGRDHPMNTMRTLFAAGKKRTQRAQAVGARPIRSASFVSAMMDAQVMRRVGLPIADFFIWNDDFEYTTGLVMGRDGIAVESSVALHHTKTFGTTNANPGPRFYNDVRNKLWVFTRRRTLHTWEKILYGGSTARLWISTIAKTEDKKTYLGYLWRGLQDGARNFCANEQVLAGVYDLELPQQNVSVIQKSLAQEGGLSVLMCVYAKDDAQYLSQALYSNSLEQTRQPDEFVLVQDGPLTDELYEVIAKWAPQIEAAGIKYTPLVLANNGGLANALNAGLELVSHEFVARADADDISLPERFEKQLAVLAENPIAVLGSSMLEVSKDASSVEGVRNARVGERKIAATFARRNPIFHPTVILRKSAVQSVGGYEEVPGAEDYWLWARLSKAGFQLNNMNEPLAKYRTGAGTYAKRGGLAALKQDISVQQRLYAGGILSRTQAIKNLGVRAVYRLAPLDIRTKAFRLIIGRKNG